MTKKKAFIPAAVKVFLALTSFTGTIGLWNMLSNRDFAVVKNRDTSDLAALNLSPIPTLVPLVTIDMAVVNSDTSNSFTQPSSELRKIQKPQPPVGSQSQITSNNTPDILPAPVTVTRSSR